MCETKFNRKRNYENDKFTKLRFTWWEHTWYKIYHLYTLVCGRNDTCTYFTLNLSCFMDIKMKNFCLDPFQRLTVGAFTRYVTFHKR